MTTVQTWIEAAYNRYAGNDPGKLAVDPELIGHLDRVYQRLWSLLARARPELLESSQGYTLVGGPAFLTLPNDLVDVTSVFSNGLGVPCAVIPVREVNRTWHNGVPAFYRLSAKLISRNQANDPVAGDFIVVTMLQAPTSLTALSDVIDPRFPTRHHQLPIDILAMYLGTKDPARDPADRAALAGELGMAAGAFIAEYQLPPSALSWVHESEEHTAMPKP